MLTNILAFFTLAITLTSCLPAAMTATTTAVTLTLAKDRTVGNTVDDITLSLKIKKAFFQHGFNTLYSKINVEVSEGRVLLTGIVEKETDIVSAVDIAWQQKETEEVINELKLLTGHKYTAAQYAKDVFITSQIKTKTILSSKIKFINYTIVTVNNIVYIFGIARSEKELEIVDDIAARIPGVTEVVNYAKLKQNSENSN